MKFTALVTIGAVSSVAYAQSPEKSAPDGCKESYDGKFSVGVLEAGSAKRQSACEKDGALVLTLKDGVLTDSKGRIGYIASNYQLQFDGPPQENAIYTSGFSACSSGLLALGSETEFYQCLSGDFFNLYDRDWADQCKAITIAINPCGGSSGGGSVGQIPDGQPQASQIPDGQVQAPTGLPATQIGDGQVQAPTGAPVTQIPDGQIQAPSAPVGAPISQIPDGQIQAPSAPAGNPISQIPDGQIQAPTGTPPPPPPPPPAPTGAPITQIPDGQVQAPTEAPAPPAGNPISQIPDGQVQAPTGTPVPLPRPQPSTLLPVPPPPATTPAPSPIPTGAASQMAPHAALAVAAFGAVLFL